nr:phage-holin analog protein [Salmonella sp. NCTC 7297]
MTMDKHTTWLAYIWALISGICAQWTLNDYINHGDGYAPGWRREFSRTGDGMTGNLYLKNEGRINLAIVDEAETPRMWLFKDKGGDGVHINNGNDGGGILFLVKTAVFMLPQSAQVSAESWRLLPIIIRH